MKLILQALRTVVCTIHRMLLALYDMVEVLTTGWASPALSSKIPHPRGLPFFGYMPFLGRHPHETLATVAKRYDGKEFCLLAGRRRFLVISRIESIRRLSQQFPRQLRDRPRNISTDQMTAGLHNDNVYRWMRRRAYTEVGLRDVLQILNRDVFINNISQMISQLQQLAGHDPLDIFPIISMASASVVYEITYGRKADDDTFQKLKRITEILPHYTEGMAIINWMDIYPMWRKLCPQMFNRFVDFNQNISSFCRLEQSRSLSRTDDNCDSPDANLFDFLRMQLENVKSNRRDRLQLTDGCMYDTLEDVIRAGTESITIASQWFILYLTAFPHVQTRMRHELQTRWSESTWNVDSISKLSYCMAAFYETLRFSCMIPMVSRILMDDIVIDGVTIPKNTVMLINNWTINFDPRHWQHPEVFDPERFLTPDGEFDEEKKSLFLPFGFGKRHCIGVGMTEMVCPLIVCAIAQRWKLEYDGEQPDFDSIFGITSTPVHFKLKLLHID